jgi:RNA polymerase sigma factor (TIGR02999 family)
MVCIAMGDITRIAICAQAGDAHSGEELLPLVYSELRKLAAAKMATEPPGQTLQPTALVHEAWLRLQALRKQDWQNRGQFFATAAEAMRRILVDNARRKRAQRHGGGQERVELPEAGIAAPADDDRLLAVHEAVDKLALADPRKAELVKLRYFVGLSVDEAAEALGISAPTAKRDWAYAKAWLYQEMGGAFGPAAGESSPQARSGAQPAG